MDKGLPVWETGREYLIYKKALEEIRQGML